MTGRLLDVQQMLYKANVQIEAGQADKRQSSHELPYLRGEPNSFTPDDEARAELREARRDEGEERREKREAGRKKREESE